MMFHFQCIYGCTRSYKIPGRVTTESIGITGMNVSRTLVNI